MASARRTKRSFRTAAAAAATASAAAAKQRRTVLTWVAAAAVILIAVGIVIATRRSSPARGSTVAASSTAPSSTSSTADTGATTRPPWPLPSDARADIAAAGLTPQSAENTAVHYHAHLDVIVNGAAVTVPAQVGFVFSGGQPTGITALHTHDTSGVIHIESPTNTPYTLGQFFTEWGVALTSNRIGGMVAAGKDVLHVYVDGKPFTADPAGIVLAPHQEIVLWYGSSAPQNPPATYAFPEGE